MGQSCVKIPIIFMRDREVNERDELIGEWPFRPEYGENGQVITAPKEAVDKRNELKVQLWEKYPYSKSPNRYPEVRILRQKTKDGNTVFIVRSELREKSPSKFIPS